MKIAALHQGDEVSMERGGEPDANENPDSDVDRK